MFILVRVSSVIKVCSGRFHSTFLKEYWAKNNMYLLEAKKVWGHSHKTGSWYCLGVLSNFPTASFPGSLFSALREAEMSQKNKMHLLEGKKVQGHSHKTGSWYHLGVLFKLSGSLVPRVSLLCSKGGRDERLWEWGWLSDGHSHPFYIGVPSGYFCEQVHFDRAIARTNKRGLGRTKRVVWSWMMSDIEGLLLQKK